MVKIGKVWLALLALLFSWGRLGLEATWAQDYHFEVSVDRKKIGLSEPLQLTLSIRANKSIPSLPAPRVKLGDFQVQGPTVSNSFNMINGRTQVERQLIYTLYPRRQGTFTIGPVEIDIEGKTYSSQVIRVQVAKGAGRRAQVDRGLGASNEQASIEENLYIRAQADRNKVYVGQQVLVDFDLCYRFRLRNVGFKELPTFNGFWSKDIFEAKELQSRRTVIDGVQFNVAPLRRLALFPTSAGTKTIEPMAVSADVPIRQTRRNRLFDDFGFGGASQTMVIRSKPIELEVLPLPQTDRPPEFNGVVGAFSLRSRLEPRQLAVGDPATFRIEINGLGNMEAVQLADLALPEGVKVYEPKVEFHDQTTQKEGVGGVRVFEYVLIPSQPGPVDVPPVHFVYFDPYKEAYQRLSTEPVRLMVEGQAEVVASPEFQLSRKQIEVVGRDIRHIKPDVSELETPLRLYRNPAFWTGQALLPLVFVALVFYQRHQRRLEGDVAYARRRRARGEAGKRLRAASQHLKEGDSGAFHEQIHGALVGLLADQLNLNAAALTPQTSEELLRERGVDPQLVETLVDLLKRCDYVRFASSGSGKGDMEKVHTQAEELVAALEKAL